MKRVAGGLVGVVAAAVVLSADRAARGGGNPVAVMSSVSDAEPATFKKGIV